MGEFDCPSRVSAPQSSSESTDAASSVSSSSQENSSGLCREVSALCPRLLELTPQRFWGSFRTTRSMIQQYRYSMILYRVKSAVDKYGEQMELPFAVVFVVMPQVSRVMDRMISCDAWFRGSPDA
jgi:hypothetical protein